MNRPSPRRDSAATRQRLIDTAEALFAERGVDNVTLADIARAAGQKNRNALQYHFGNKDSLIHAVLDKHRAHIEQQRNRMLDTLEAQSDYSLRDIIAVLVLPVASLLAVKDSGVAYLKLNSQLMAAEHYAELRLARAQTIAEGQRMDALLRARLGHIDASELETRLLLVDCLLFHGLASYSSRRRRVARARFVDTLLDSMVAVLART